MTESPERAYPTRKRSALALVAASLGLLFVSLAVLEAVHPYYFFEDDNRDHLLPFFLVAYRTLATGELAQIDFHQALGMPLLANGLSSVLSPLPYLAIAAGRALVGHDSAAIEILVAMYFAIGAVGSVFLGRRLHLSDAAVLFGTVTWVCNPFLVYLSISWVTLCPLVAFLPWIMGFSLALREGVTPRRVAGLVAAHLGLLFAGFVQWFVYAVLFELAVHALLALRDRRRGEVRLPSLVAIAGVLAVVFVLGLPLLMPMWNQTQQSVERSVPLPFSIYLSEPFPIGSWLNGVVAPWTRLFDPTGADFVERASPAGLSHLGYLSLFLIPLVFRRRTGEAHDDGPWFAFGLLAAVALLWAFGIVARPIYWIPVLNRFRWSFKLLALANFFLCWLAAAGLQRWLATRRPKTATSLAPALVLLQFANLLVLNATHGQRGFRQHTDPVPLTEPRVADFGLDRIASVGRPPLRADSLRTVGRLGFDYASFFGIYAFSGYDPLMTQANGEATLLLNYEGSWNGPPSHLPVALLRNWDVRWYAVPRTADRLYAPVLVAAGLTLVETREDRVLYRDDAALPLASWNSAEEPTHHLLPTHYRGNSMFVAADLPRDALVTVRLLSSSFYDATIDGQRVGWRENPLRQFVLAVPVGHHEIRLRYSDPYFRLGTATALLSLAVGTLAVIVWRNRGRRRLGGA